ncbi:hypothetical protein GCM10023194_21200 [Planotetraspora phitsanulokensis]|uniref:DUF4402 domain-containing protein n=1 Tax=Planotetraspora phitsanulokensis TaxID=575192 RepID=A0A8J3XJ34_9ACTN|nr:hypothetical protein Pph01_31810 [Planotetraspora phitsanulokensis]
MHRRTAFLATPALLVTLLVTLPGPPAEATPGAATFMLPRAGALTITAPVAMSLGSAPPGGTMTVQMQTMTVTDTREPGAGRWTASVSSTNYTRTTTPVVTIDRANMSYWSGPATATQGGGTFVPGQPTAAQRVSLSATRVAFSHVAIAGVNNCNWRPTLTMSIPFAGVTTGTYTGVITHSVA